MAFSSTIEGKTVSGDKARSFGTFTNGASDTGGDIDTGLKTVLNFSITHSGSGTVTEAPAANESFPLKGSDVTIVTTSGADGFWEATGYE